MCTITVSIKLDVTQSQKSRESKINMFEMLPTFPQTAQDVSFKFTTINYAQNAKDSSTSTKPR